MTKPLSETHKTLVNDKRWIERFCYLTLGATQQEIIQATTVDIDEHELVIKQRDSWEADAVRHALNTDYWKAEVERLKFQIEEYKKACKEYEAVFVRSIETEERLKKELEIQRKANFDALLERFNDAIESKYTKGIAEGERRAMERVKEATEKHLQYCIRSSSCMRTLQKELGLSERKGEL